MFVIVALTARAGQYIFCEQVVRVNQEQSHFSYNKLYTIIINHQSPPSNPSNLFYIETLAPTKKVRGCVGP